jgi:small-conductance mechanosensitive channel
MKLKVVSITKSYGKTIMMDNYSFKFGVTLSYEVELDDENQLEEINRIIQQKAEKLVNDDIKGNQEVMKKLTGGKYAESR